MVCLTDSFFLPPVGHSVPPLLHSIGQHRAGAARQSVCGHRSDIQLDWLRENHTHAAGLLARMINTAGVWYLDSVGHNKSLTPHSCRLSWNRCDWR